MFRDFTATNFRCFSSLHLKQLDRVNLIAGKNNTGKTAVLEAIHLHCDPGNCATAVEINRMARGIANPFEAMEEVCHWFFMGGDSERAIELSSCDEKRETRTLQIRLVDAETSRKEFPEAEKLVREGFQKSIASANVPRLILRFEDAGGEQQTSVAVQSGMGAYGWSGEKTSWSLPTLFLGSDVANVSAKDVDHFGKMEAAKRQREILPSLQIVEPRLQRLSLIPFAGQTVLHADVGMDRMIPVSFAGEGLRRLLSIVLAIANARGGEVLIDEIENGLHYSVMTEVWRAIAAAARKEDVQVFATTHSWECIRAAHDAFTQDESYDLSMHRLDRSDNEISAVHYDREMIETALLNGLEMR